MNRRVPDELIEKYPHYEVYAKCQAEAFRAGSFTFVASFACVYVAQELLKSHLPYPRSSFLLAPILLGSVMAWGVTRQKSRICQNMWMAMEDKHTALTPASERSSFTTEPTRV